MIVLVELLYQLGIVLRDGLSVTHLFTAQRREVEPVDLDTDGSLCTLLESLRTLLARRISPAAGQMV